MPYQKMNLQDGDILKAAHLEHIEEGIEKSLKPTNLVYNIRKTAVEFYLSLSNRELVGGQWVTVMPIREEGKHMWMRIRTQYIEPDVITYSEPFLDMTTEIVVARFG